MNSLPDPNHAQAIGWLLMGLAALLVIARNAVGFWRDLNKPSGPERREIQQPLDVRTVAELAKEKDCVARRDAVEQRIEVLEDRRIQDAKDASTSRSLLYKHIDDVRVELSGKIDAMPAQIITILKNTGAIK